MNKQIEQPMITMPFSAAYGVFETPSSRERKDFPNVRTSQGEIDYSTGLPPAMATIGIGESKLEKSELNQLCYLMTLGAFRNQRGWKPTYEEEVAEAIGGYPKGTILRYSPYERAGEYSWNWSYDVISMQDNNKKNFRVVNNPNPYKIGSLSENKVWWKIVTEGMLTTNDWHLSGMSLLPDLSTTTERDNSRRASPEPRFVMMSDSKFDFCECYDRNELDDVKYAYTRFTLVPMLESKLYAPFNQNAVWLDAKPKEVAI